MLFTPTEKQSDAFEEEIDTLRAAELKVKIPSAHLCPCVFLARELVPEMSF